jgi:hypothetical protein
MARAVYCKCKNTYSIDCGKGNKKCKADEYWKQGIGSIHNDDHVSNVVNEDTERTETHTASTKTSEEGDITNIDTTRIINN